MLLQNPHFPVTAKFLMNENLTEKNIQGDDQDAPSLRSLKGWYLQTDGTEPSTQGIYKRPRVFKDRDLNFILRLLLSSKLFKNLTGWKNKSPPRSKWEVNSCSSAWFSSCKLEQDTDCQVCGRLVRADASLSERSSQVQARSVFTTHCVPVEPFPRHS